MKTLNALFHQNDGLQPSLDDLERRVAPRTKVLKRGQVIFNNNFSTFDCIVRNISATGALLTLDENAHLPKEFDLRIGEDKTVRPARLVYRRGALTGIRFVDVPLHEEEVAMLAVEEQLPPVEAAHKPAGTIRRVAAEPLPFALKRNFRWARSF